MIYKDMMIEGTHGCPLTLRQWLPEGEMKGMLQVFHGMGEHGLRYEEFAGYLTANGWGLACHDHRQHGSSIGHDEVGIYDETDTWEAMTMDAHKAYEAVREGYEEITYIMMGHSMGSMLIRSYLHQYEPKIDGAIIMGSPFAGKGAIVAGKQLATVINRFQPKKRSQVMFKMMNDPLATQVKDRTSEADWISYDQEQVDLYNADPLSGYVYNAAFYREFCKGYLEANDPENMKGWPKLATLIIAGNDDPAAGNGKGPIVVERRYKSYGVPCQLKLMANMRHEVLNEVEKDLSYKAVLDFLEECL